MVTISPRGDKMATACEPTLNRSDKVRVWDTKTGELLLTLRAHAHQVAWSPDGRWLATGDFYSNMSDDHAVLLWDIDHLTGR